MPRSSRKWILAVLLLAVAALWWRWPRPGPSPLGPVAARDHPVPAVGFAPEVPPEPIPGAEGPELSMGAARQGLRAVRPGRVAVAPGPLVRWPAGQGGEADGEERPAPAIELAITYPFWLAETECTQAFWEEVMGASANPSPWRGPDLPVCQVTWWEIERFFERLNQQTASSRPEGMVYRLPTDGEWEFALRAGGSADPFAGAGLEEIAWFRTNSGGQPQPVGRLRPNALGLYDLLGNVFERVADVPPVHTTDYLGAGGRVEDPYYPPAGDGQRASRGGCFDNGFDIADPFQARSRDGEQGLPLTGFRIALGPPLGP